MLRLIEQRQRAQLVDAAASLARDHGLAAAVTVLAAVQHEVGLRWQTNQWSVADEHAATAMVDVALTAASLEGPPPSVKSSEVLVVCAEDEWHVLPARMFAEQLRHDGWDVAFVGASAPVDHLERYLRSLHPIAVALSCSVAIHLPGARRSVDACHSAGVPVVVGGAAFGGSLHRASAIGADAWAADAGVADRIISAWADRLPDLATPTVDDEPARSLASARRAVVADAMTALAVRYPPVTEYSPTQLARTREDFDYILRFVEAALVVDDDSVVVEFSTWLSSVLIARGLPSAVVPISVRALADCVPKQLAEADRLLQVALRHMDAVA